MARIILKHAQLQSDWESSTFVLAKGEAGVALDTGAVRIGNGVDLWKDLPTVTNTVLSVAGRTGDITLTKSDVGLGDVDNTADLAKPMSAAVATKVADLQQQITDIGEAGGATKESIGLGNVDNTSDMDKPISTATQISLNSKASINNPIFTGNVQGISKSMVGLAQVDNTSDISKPISTATQNALNAKISSTDSRLTDKRVPVTGSVTDSSVASNAAISLDKTVDTATRIAMQPVERTVIADVANTLGNIHSGVVTAGTGALANYTSIPSDASIVAVGPNSLGSATTIDSTVSAGDNALSKGAVITRQIAIGDNALEYAGSVSTQRGADNIALGQNSSRFLTTASQTVAIGVNTGMGRNTTGDVGIGQYANSSIVIKGLSGDWEQHSVLTPPDNSNKNNLAIGANALMTSGGNGNVAIGGSSLQYNASGKGNLAIGNGSLSLLGYKEGPSGLVRTYLTNSNGTYTWSGTQLTIAISNHGVQQGDYVNLRLTGGNFVPSAVTNFDSVRGIVDTVVDANTFTVAEWNPGKPIQSLEDVGNVRLNSYEREVYSGSDDSNIAIGDNAGSGISSGTYNIFIGGSAGPAIDSTITSAVMVGGLSGFQMSEGNEVLLLGALAGTLVKTADKLTIVGSYANGSETSTNAVAVGSESMANGSDTTAVGATAASGTNGVSIGSGVIGADNSIAIGKSANANELSTVIGINGTTTGDTSIAIGNSANATYSALAIGDSSAASDNSIAIGVETTTADNSIAVGHGVVAAENEARFATDAHNTVVSGSTAAIEAVTTDIGMNATATNINIGNTNTNIQIGESNQSGKITLSAQLVTIDDAGITSDARDKTDIRDTSLGLDFINKVRPVEYRWAKRGEQEGTRFHQGIIAQELKQVSDDLGIDFGGYIDQSVNGGDDQKTVRYTELIAPLIKAVQELSAQVEELKKNG